MTTMKPARVAAATVSRTASGPTMLACRPAFVLCHERNHKQHVHTPKRRRLHSTAQKEVALPINASHSSTPVAFAAAMNTAVAPALSCLPLSQVLRSYFITAISSHPALLEFSTKSLRTMLESNNPLLNLHNPLMKAVLYETFYKQFCTGSDAVSISNTCGKLREQGYAGVILEYALEVLKESESDECEDVATWRKGMLDSVAMTSEGDFTALKWSGMGSAAMRRMRAEGPPSKAMSDAMHAVCQAASAKNIGLLPSAEETWSLNGYHNWCLDLQRAYNTNGKSVLYNTYQCYLKQTPHHIARHLQIAKDEGFTLGVKLVRGAYLGSEQRNLIWPSIEATHHSYDQTTSAMIHRQYNDFLKPVDASEKFPEVNVVVASHNAATVEKAQAWRQTQAARGENLTPLVFAQLQGMADEVSCSLLANVKANQGKENAVQERVYKATTWGTMYECLNYLLRRAAENKDAAGRTSETRDAMRAELGNRFKRTFGIA